MNTVPVPLAALAAVDAAYAKLASVKTTLAHWATPAGRTMALSRLWAARLDVVSAIAALQEQIDAG